MAGPATVLRRRRGHCFEASSLLASLLIAAGYDAYVVSGYAAQTTCAGDQSYDDCPLLASTPVVAAPAAEPACRAKYLPRPAKQLRSAYEQMMAARHEAERERIRAEKIAEELAERAASRYSVSFIHQQVVVDKLNKISNTE